MENETEHRDYRFERKVDGEWCPYGTYDLSQDRELAAMLCAAQEFHEYEIRAVRI